MLIALPSRRHPRLPLSHQPATMGRCIRAQRRGAPGSVFRTVVLTRKGPSHLRKLDYAERNGYIRGVVEEIMHDPGRGAPMCSVKFRNPYRNQRDLELMVVPEGVYSGQFIYCGKKAAVAVGNVLPLSSLPEGSVVCNVERYPGDRGKLAKTSGEYVTVITHNEDTGLTKVRMPSGAKKNLSSDARAMVRMEDGEGSAHLDGRGEGGWGASERASGGGGVGCACFSQHGVAIWRKCDYPEPTLPVSRGSDWGTVWHRCRCMVVYSLSTCVSLPLSPFRSDRHRGRRRPYRQARAEGRAQPPQVRGQGQPMAPRAWCGHERRGPPPRWRQPPAFGYGGDPPARRAPRPEVRSHCCAPHGSRTDRQAGGGRGINSGAGWRARGQQRLAIHFLEAGLGCALCVWSPGCCVLKPFTTMINAPVYMAILLFQSFGCFVWYRVTIVT